MLSIAKHLHTNGQRPFVALRVTICNPSRFV
jgi:hypothetical protein